MHEIKRTNIFKTDYVKECTDNVKYKAEAGSGVSWDFD